METPPPPPTAVEWFPLAANGEMSRLDLASVIGTKGEDGFTYLDCGAWTGDGKSAPKQRNFALICGRSVVLCSFLGNHPAKRVEHGTESEIGPINKVIDLLAGPQRLDVTIIRSLRALGDDEPDTSRVYLLLPDMHLPIVTKLPQLDPNLVPDPNLATCPCHGPMVTRILYGTTASTQYRAVGTLLSRNPSDWFYMMAESHKGAASDLAKFLDRLAKRPMASLHIVQLGGLFDFWGGYDCVFQGNGRMAFVRPRVLDRIDADDLEGLQHDTISTRILDAVVKLIKLPAQRRTLLGSGYDHGVEAGVESSVETRARSFEVPGVLLAENRPEPLLGCEHQPPFAFLALREQQAQFRPWIHATRPGFRLSILANVIPRWREKRFKIYAMAHTHSPCLMNVVVGGDAPPAARAAIA